jgi:hypothetical protein
MGLCCLVQYENVQPVSRSIWTALQKASPIRLYGSISVRFVRGGGPPQPLDFSSESEPLQLALATERRRRGGSVHQQREGGEEATQSVTDPIEFSGASCRTAATGILARDPRWVSCSGSGRRPPVRFPRSSPEIPASDFDRILLALVLGCGSLFWFYFSSKGNSSLRWINTGDAASWTKLWSGAVRFFLSFDWSNSACNWKVTRDNVDLNTLYFLGTVWALN